MKKKFLVLFGVVIIVVIIIWAPWLTQDYAETRVINSFSSKWEGVSDGCGFNCDGCGLKESHKTSFGYSVKIEYACGLILEDSLEYHIIDDIFISNLGTLHGL